MAYSNIPARLGTGTNNLAGAADYPLVRWTNDYMLLLSLYRGSWIIRKVIDVIAEDMLKDWPRIKSELDPVEIKKFDQAVTKTATHAKMLEALKWGRLFGGSVAVICLKGMDVNGLAEPLNIEEIELDSYRGLIPLDRWSGVFPSAELITDLDNPAEFGLPKYYDCDLGSNGHVVKIHHSRVLRFTGRDLPNWEKQVQLYWGLSEIEVVFDELKKWDYANWTSVSMLSRGCIWAIKEPDLAQILSGASVSTKALENYVTRLQAISDSMNNQGLLALGKDGGLENYAQSFAGISDLLDRYALNIAGACEYPVSRLFGQTHTGLGQSGEGDLQIYYDTVEQKRKRELRPQMDKLFPIIAMSTWGEIPDDLDYDFPPVRTMTEKDKSDLAKTNSDAIIAAFNSNIISQKTALMELRQQSEVTGLFSNITDEMISSANDDTDPLGEMSMGGKDPLGAVERETEKPKAQKEAA